MQKFVIRTPSHNFVGVLPTDQYKLRPVFLTVRLCMGGLTVLRAGSLPISFFSDSDKIMRFYDFARTSVS